MREPHLLLCGPAFDAEESAASLQKLREITLPDVTKYVVTVSKFDTQGSAKTFNVEAGAGHPAVPAHLLTLAQWAECPPRADPRFRDGYDLFCLRSIVEREDSADYAILLRDAADLPMRWRHLLAQVETRLFLTFGAADGADDASSRNLLLNLRDRRMASFLDIAQEIFTTGAAFGLPAYSLHGALTAAAEALRLEQDISSA